ncbi:hypothetical protein BLNAU_4885 [Blattamonas nauphoetae]|uniref:Tail specific protease domain-containing protein n=1 Tax=Blattamonas nauphoetae TaxID=2049346 RepID=A0ABQ9Y8B5_9EUKA|nr:hypothetical protein BLNAU_4885 [Blattamonas nauphoetae]
MLLIISLFHLSLAERGICEFKPDAVYTLAEARECLYSIPKGENDIEVKNMPERLKGYEDNLVFRSLHMNPPSPWEDLKLDLYAEIDKVKYTDYDTAMEYYEALMGVFKIMKDPHTLFTPPCRSAFYFYLPFDFSATLNPENPKEILITAQTIEKNNMTKQFVDAGNPDITGRTITRIGLDGETLPENEQAAETIAKWADRWLPTSKDKAARFNRAINSDFAIRQAARYETPKTDVLVEYIDEGGVEKKTLKLPFFSLCTKEMKTLDDVCPIRPPPADTFGFSGTETNPTEEFQKELTEPVTMGSKKKSFGTSNDDSQFEKIEDTSYILCLKHKTDNYGYLKIKTFSYEKMTDFGDTLAACLIKLKKADVKDVIIDVRSNGGGYVALGMQTVNLLFPSLYPSYGVYDMPITDTNTEMLKSVESENKYRDPTSDRLITRDESYNKRQVDKKFKDTEGKEFTQRFTQPFILELSIPDIYNKTRPQLATMRSSSYAPLWDRDHLYVLTDGMCGSTCACFTKHIEEANVARIIGVGGYPGKLDEKFDVASFAGGTVFSASSVYAEKYKNGSKVDKSKMPADFDRASTEVRWAQHAIYSFDPKDAANEVFLEFKVNPVDTVINFYGAPSDESEAGILALMGEVKKVMGKCVEGEVSIEKNRKDKKNTVSHALYGYKCNAETGTFDNTTWALSRCEDKYYLNKDGLCVMIPSVKKMQTIVTSIVIAGVLVLCLIVIVIVVVCGCIRSSKDKKQGYEKIGDVGSEPGTSQASQSIQNDKV